MEEQRCEREFLDRFAGRKSWKVKTALKWERQQKGWLQTSVDASNSIRVENLPMIWTFLSRLPLWPDFEKNLKSRGGRFFEIFWNCNLFQELMNRFERYFIRIIRRMKGNSKNIAVSKRIRNWIWKKEKRYFDTE